MFLMARFLYGSCMPIVWDCIIYLSVMACFFGLQLLLCLRSSKLKIKLIPIYILSFFLLELLGFSTFFVIIGDEFFAMLFLVSYAYGYLPMWVAIAIAGIVARRIKKKKAQKQNSVTQ